MVEPTGANKKETGTNTTQPKAIFASFFATFISLLVTLILIFIKVSLKIETDSSVTYGTVAYVLLFFIFILVFRHQLRVVFIDSVYVKSIELGLNKNVLRLLIVTASMGSLVILVFFTFGLTAVSWFMVFYCLFFIILGLLMLGGQQRSPNEKAVLGENMNAVLSIIIDVFCIILWVLSASQSTNGLSLSNGLLFVLVVITGIIIYEFRAVFENPFVLRVKQLWEMIKP